MLAVVAAAAMLVLSSQAALALTPTHVTVGGSSSVADVPFTASNDGPVDFLTDFTADPVPMTCSGSTISGVIKRGAAVEANSVIGHIDSMGSKDCDATGLHYPWVLEWGEADIVALGQVTEGQPVPVKITGIDARMHSTGSLPWALDAGLANRWGVDLLGMVYLGSGGSDGRLEIHDTAYALALTAFDGTGTDTPTAGGTFGGNLYTGDNVKTSGDFELDTDGAGVIDHR